jgi:uncharacterized protein (DUF488 family)
VPTQNPQPAVVYTTGHSNRPIDAFLGMLRAAGIEALIDVRAQPALIADYLTAIGVRVLHLIEPDSTADHRLNPAARWDGAALIYDRSGQPPLPLGD